MFLQVFYNLVAVAEWGDAAVGFYYFTLRVDDEGFSEDAFFDAIFNTVPTYAEIDLRTKEKSSLPDVNELFLIRTSLKSTYGELASINLEHFFDNLFKMRRRFRDLGMVIKDGEVYLPDLTNKSFHNYSKNS